MAYLVVGTGAGLSANSFGRVIGMVCVVLRDVWDARSRTRLESGPPTTSNNERKKDAMEDPHEDSLETIVYTAMHEGHTRSYGEMTTKAVVAAFAEYPNALHAYDPFYLSVYENRDGEPAPMTIIKVRLKVPFSPKGEADNG